MDVIADALTNTAENRMLDWVMGNATTAPTMPLKVALVTVVGNDTTAGTEVTGGSYARKTLTAGAAVNGATSNSADLVWTGMPAATVVGVDVYDSAGAPVRWLYGALAANRTVLAGDELKILAGQLTFSLA